MPRIIGFVIMPFTVRKRRSLLETEVDFDAEVSEVGSLLADDSVPFLLLLLILNRKLTKC